MQRMYRPIVAVCIGACILILASDNAAAIDPEAVMAEGVRYEHGEGVEQDYARAYRLYCIAAVQGNADAAYRLGWMYLNGRGMPEQDAMAVGWFQVATERGDAYSRRLLKSVLTEAKAKADPDCPLYTPRPDRATIKAWVHALAPRYGIDPDLVLAVIEVESRFNPRARSPRNAQGLMQLIPATATRFSIKDPLDPFQNLIGGMRYLRWLLDYFDDDIKLALAAYNAGEQAVKRYGGVPPYPETQNYVSRIVRLMGEAERHTARAELNEVSFNTTQVD